MLLFLQTKEQGAISVIPNYTEKYIGFSWRRFIFIDSLAFLNAPVEKLVKGTPDDAFHHLAHHFGDPQENSLMMRKGVYPYEYMDSFDRFEEIALPPKEAFHSSLSGKVSIYEYSVCVCVCVHVWVFTNTCI